MTHLIHTPEARPDSYEFHFDLHESKFPVIKIDFEGTILYANKAAFSMIRDWGCFTSRKLPANLLTRYPELLDHNASTEMELPSSGCVVKFNVIAFHEAGYTGLYGYEMKPIAT